MLDVAEVEEAAARRRPWTWKGRVYALGFRVFFFFFLGGGGWGVRA